MTHTIQISDGVYDAIQKDAIPLEDTADTVLLRWAFDRGLINQTSELMPVQKLTQPHRRRKRRSPRRIDEFTLFDNTYHVSAWWEMYVKIAEVLTRKHPNKINYLQELSQVRKSPNDVLYPRQIPGTNLWFASNLSAGATIEHVNTLLRSFGHDPKKVLTFKEHLASADAIRGLR